MCRGKYIKRSCVFELHSAESSLCRCSCLRPPPPLHCSNAGTQVRSKARSVSIMHSSIIHACVIPF